MKRQSMNNPSSCHRWRCLAFLAAIAIPLGAASESQAKISFISGIAFLEEDLPDPDGFGNEVIVGFGLARADDELADADFDLFFIDLFGYVDPTDTVFLDPLLLLFDDPNNPDGPQLKAEFLFELDENAVVGSGALDILPSPQGLFGSGSITAEIVGIGVNETGIDLSGFVGGQFQLTYNGVAVTAGTGAAGDAGSAEFAPVSTASFSMAVEIPEPASFLLAAIGMVGLLSMRRITRTRRRQQPST